MEVRLFEGTWSTRRHSLYEEKLHLRFVVGVREHTLLSKSTELSLEEADAAEARLLLYLSRGFLIRLFFTGQETVASRPAWPLLAPFVVLCRCRRGGAN